MVDRLLSQDAIHPHPNSFYWKEITPISNPPVDEFVWTCIKDADGRNVRCIQRMRWNGKSLWFLEDGTYVYYSPTHFWSV